MSFLENMKAQEAVKQKAQAYDKLMDDVRYKQAYETARDEGYRMKAAEDAAARLAAMGGLANELTTQESLDAVPAPLEPQRNPVIPPDAGLGGYLQQGQY
jgi:cell fate (sporulation/competence/biofilm development) regulator YlbF (YheA/YmcA/DUF963 family)